MSVNGSSPFFESIREKLLILRARQRRLIAVGAFGHAIAGLVALTLSACFVESLLPSNDQLRWMLSFAFYSLAAVILFIAMKPLLRRSTMEQTAVEVERRVPEVREQLLATVELAAAPDSNPAISRAFCQALEQHVVALLDRVDHSTVFPVNSVRRPLAAGSVMLAFWFVVSLFPESHLWQRLGNVMLPTSGIYNIAKGQIIVLRPRPPETTVPDQEVMIIEAAWSETMQNGPTLQLEVRESVAPKASRVQAMTRREDASDPSRDSPAYIAQWPVEDRDFEFRILGGSERTPWYKVSVLPRPRIEGYRKVLIAPEYAGSTPKEIEEPHGNIDAIVGSTARIAIKTNVPLSRAEIRYKTAKSNPSSLAASLNDAGDGTWFYEMPIEEDASYQIHLWAAGSNFESSFDPTSRILAREDKPPTIKWLEPTTRHHVIRPSSSLELKARIDDEFPLRSVTHQYRVNRGAWTQLPLSSINEMDAEWSWQFDLYPMRLKRGDFLELQVLAVDAKWQTGESPILEYVLSAAELDASRSPQTVLRQSLAALIRNWNTKIEDSTAALNSARDAWQNSRSDTELQSALAEKLRQHIELAHRELSSVRLEIRLAMPQLQSGVAIVELDRVLAELGKLDAELLQPMNSAINRMPRALENAENQSAKRIEQVLELVEAYNRSARSIEERFQKFIVHDVLADLAHDLEAAFSFQKDLMNSSSKLGSVSWSREQELLMHHLTKLGRAMEQQSAYVDGNTAQQLRQWSQWAEHISQRILNTIQNFDAEDADAIERTRNEMEQVRNELLHRRSIQNVQGNYVHEANQARRHSEDSSGRSDEIIRQAADRLFQIESDGSGHPADRQGIARQLDQLSHRRDLLLDTERFQDSIVSVLGMAYRAATAAVESAELDAAQRRERLNDIASVVRKLEAVHRLTESEALLGEIWQIERWERSESSARVENPRSWDAFRDWYERAITFLREAGFDHQAVNTLDQLKWSQDANQAQHKITQRRWEVGEPVSAASEIERLRRAIAAAKAGLDKDIADARSKLESLSPSISDLARKAAQEARIAQSQAASAAEQATRLDPWERQRILEDQDADAQNPTAPINQLLNALTEQLADPNPRSDSHMQQAVSAELGRELVEQSKAKIAESIQKAQQAGGSDGANALEELAKSQGDAAQSLDALADHLDLVRDSKASNEMIASSREALSQRFRHDAESATDPAQATAEQLVRSARSDPQSLRQWLEKELQENAPMRASLSELADQLVAEAEKNLEYDAQRERSLQSRLEQSDQAYDLRKRFFQDELSHFAEQNHREAQRLANDIQSLAAQGLQPDLQQQAQQLAQTLADATSTARNANGQAPMRELQELLGQLKQAIQQTLPDLESLQSGFQRGAEQPIYERDEQRQEAKRQAETAQQRTRDQDMRAADADVQRRERRRQQLEQTKQQFEQQARQAREQLDRSRQQIEQQPNAEWLRSQVDQATSRVEQLQNVQDLATSMIEQEESRLSSARSRRETLAASPNPLEAMNPKAELAAKLVEQSAERLKDIVNGLQELQNQSGWQHELQADRGSLQEAVHQQAAVMSSLSETAEQLHRASHHYSRLNRSPEAQSMELLSNRVADTAIQEATSAMANLQQASQSEAAQGPSQRADARATDQAQRSLRSAESAIRQRSDELSQALAQSADGPSDPESQGDSSAANRSFPLSPKEMAQLLDELDRQLQSPLGSKANELTTRSPKSDEAAKSALDAIARKLSSPMSPASRASNAAPRSSTSQDRSRADAANAKSMASSNAVGQRPSSAFQVLNSSEMEMAEIGAWNRLRELKAEDVAESEREQVSLRYRQQIEAYFRELSKQTDDDGRN